MQNPEPSKPPGNWVPHQSVVGGAVVGTAVAQIIVAVCGHYLKGPLDAVTAGAISSLCLFTATYFIPDSTNRSP